MAFPGSVRMPFDFTSFKEVPVPAIPAGRVGMLVRLREGACKPDYVEARAWFGPTLFSTEMEADQVARLQSDPAVRSIEISQRLHGIE